MTHRRTRWILGVVVSAALIGPTTAGAGIQQELRAADEVERKLDRRARSFTFNASCRHVTSSRFTCSWVGFKDGAMANGRASVRKVSRYVYQARILSFRTVTF